MSLKGGYQIINLKNREFNSEMGNSERYQDIYFNMVNSHAKMIIVSGLNLDGVKYNDYETIFYEKDDGDGMYFQAIARRIWNTRDYKCITKYINIFDDDRVTCTQDEFTYEILPDGELSLTSTNAVQNKVITETINRIDSELDELSNSDTRINERIDATNNSINDIKKVTTITTTVTLYGDMAYKPLPDDRTTIISPAQLSYDILGNFTLRFTVQRSSAAMVGFIEVHDNTITSPDIDGWAILSRTPRPQGLNATTMHISTTITQSGFSLFGYSHAYDDDGQEILDTINLGEGNNEIVIVGKFTLN